MIYLARCVAYSHKMLRYRMEWYGRKECLKAYEGILPCLELRLCIMLYVWCIVPLRKFCEGCEREQVIVVGSDHVIISICCWHFHITSFFSPCILFFSVKQQTTALSHEHLLFFTTDHPPYHLTSTYRRCTFSPTCRRHSSLFDMFVTESSCQLR